MTVHDLVPADVLTTSPIAEADVVIAVIVGLNMPGQTSASRSLQKDLTITAVDSIHELGGKAVIHDVSDAGEPDYEAIAAAGGILVLGGGDVDATIYGHSEVVPNEYGKDRRADERELEIIVRGIGEDSIMLHLCRGAPAAGRGLWRHIDSRSRPVPPAQGRPRRACFSSTEWCNLNQGISSTTSTRLISSQSATDTIRQSVASALVCPWPLVLPTELWKQHNAWTTPGSPLGVQWHPEEGGANKADRDVLFVAFLEQARARTYRETGDCPGLTGPSPIIWSSRPRTVSQSAPG